jgi:hypothetical protein
MLEGWVCPKCGRVNAPFIDHCPCSNGNVSYPQIPSYPLYPWYPTYPWYPWSTGTWVCNNQNGTYKVEYSNNCTENGG